MHPNFSTELTLRTATPINLNSIMPLRIHRASIDDIPVIQYMAHIVWPVTFAGIFSQQEIDYMLEREYSTMSLKRQIEEKRHVYLLGKSTITEKYIAYAAYELAFKQMDEVAKLHKIYVLPDYQGRGIGKNLLQSIERMLRFKGVKRLTLNVHQQNKAVVFYERMGFDLVKTVQKTLKNGLSLDDYVYEKAIFKV